MAHKSTLIILLTLAGVIAIMAYRYEQYLVERNFVAVANVPCDPETERCFVMECDPAEDEECDVTPYKKAEVLSFEAPACMEEHTCEAFSCDTMSSCVLTYCEENTLEDGEQCFEAEPLPTEEESVLPTEEEPVTE